MRLWRWVLRGLVPVFILGSVGGPGASPAATLCHPDEQIVFNCTVKSGKIVSLCRSPELTQHQGVLHYRFGRPGAVELQFPPLSEAVLLQELPGNLIQRASDYRHQITGDLLWISLSFPKTQTCYPP